MANLLGSPHLMLNPGVTDAATKYRNQDRLSELAQELRREKQSSEHLLAAKDQQIAALRRELRTLEDQWREDLAEKDNAYGQLKRESAQRYAMLEHKIDSFLSKQQSNAEHTLAKLSEKDASLNKVMAKMKTKEQQLSEVQRRYQDKCLEFEGLFEESKSLRIQNEKLASELRKSQGQITQSSQYANELTNEIELMNQKNEDILLDLGDDLEKKTDELNQMKKLIRLLKNKEIKIKDEHRLKINHYKQEIIDLQKKLMRKLNEIDKLTNEISELEMKYENMKSELKSEKNEMKSIKEDRQKELENLKKLRKEWIKQNHETASLRTAVNKSEEREIQMKEQINNHQIIHEKWQNKCKNMEEQINNKIERIRSLQNCNDRLNLEKEKLVNQINELSKCEETFKRAEEELGHSRERIKQLEKVIEKQDCELEQMRMDEAIQCRGGSNHHIQTRTTTRMRCENHNNNIHSHTPPARIIDHDLFRDLPDPTSAQCQASCHSDTHSYNGMCHRNTHSKHRLPSRNFIRKNQSRQCSNGLCSVDVSALLDECCQRMSAPITHAVPPAPPPQPPSTIIVGAPVNGYWDGGHSAQSASVETALSSARRKHGAALETLKLLLQNRRHFRRASTVL